MSLKLYTYTPNYRAWKILIAGAYNNVDIQIVSDFKMGVDNKTPEFLRKNPLGKVPVLETPQGAIFESNAIARYVARIRNDTDLYGSSFFESSQVDQWLDACANELEPAASILLYRIFGYMEVDDEQYNEAKKDVEKFLTILDNYLLTRTYLVGNKITLADIVIGSTLVIPYQKVFGVDFASKFINLNRWFLTLMNQPNFAKVIGKVEAGQSDEKSAGKQEKGGKKDKQEKQEKGGKKDKQEKAEKKTPKQTPKEAPALDDDEDGEKTKKAKNPLDSLPPSKMILDAVKKLFFEKRPHFQNFFSAFWPMFDAEGYSIYYFDYSYNEDNKVYFMTCNLTAGYSQRLEDVRKYAFGVLNVTGKDEDTPPFNVSGCFIFRGKEVPAEVRECPDTEYYKLTPIDVSDAAQRKKVEEAFYGEKIGGDAVLDRKYFK